MNFILQPWLLLVYLLVGWLQRQQQAISEFQNEQIKTLLERQVRKRLRLASVHDELRLLEQEEKGLQRKLQGVRKQQVPANRVNEEARKLVETWQNTAELLEQASPDEPQLLLHHYIQVVEIRSTEPKDRTGTYALSLFPEICPQR